MTQHLTLLDGVVETARRDPTRVAVRDDDGALTYAELLAAAGDLADTLRRSGVCPGDRVAVELTPSREAICGYVAAWLVGTAYVPVDVTLPLRRRELLKNVAMVTATLDGRPQRGRSAPSVVEATSAPVLPPTPDDVAYVVHTSGSTGTPKAVQLEHRNLITTIDGMDSRAPIADGFVGSWWASPGFDAAAWEIWSVLHRGGTLLVVPPDRRLEPDRFIDFLVDHGVESCFLPPLYVPDFVTAIEASPGRFERLRRILVGAEPIQLGLLQRAMRAARHGLQLVNGYGPAEASVFCTLYDVPAEGGEPTARAPIGTALPGVEVEIVAPDPHTGVGELVIHGTGVARGYLGGEPGGFAARDGRPSYATGDLGRRDDSGNLVFCGRADRQFKIRGFRIEAAEIEAALLGVAGVESAVAGVREFSGVGPGVVAYVVGRPSLRLRDLRTHLEEVLPYYALPLGMVRLDRIPQSTNGKIDVGRLEGLPLDESTAEHDRAADSRDPVSPLASIIASEAPGGLGTGTLIAAGVTSLIAARIARRVRLEIGRDVSADQVLRARGWEDLRHLVDTARPVDSTVAAPRSRPGRHISFDAQLTGMWFHEQLTGQGSYRQVTAFRLGPTVDAGRLARAVGSVLADHEIFTARVAVGEDGTPGFVLGAREPRCSIDGGGPDPSAAVRDVSRRISVDGDLWQVSVLTCDEGTRLLVLAWHHLVVDYWTVRELVQEISRRYDGRDPSHQQPAAGRLAAALETRRERERALVATGVVATRATEVLADRTRWPHSDAAPSRSARGHLTFTVHPATYAAAHALAAQGASTVAEQLIELFESSICAAWDAAVVPYGLAVGDRATVPDHEVAACFVDTVLLLARAAPDPADRSAGGLRSQLSPSTRVPLALLVPELRTVLRAGVGAVPTCFLALEEPLGLTLAGSAQEWIEVPDGREDFGFTVFLRSSGDGCTGAIRFDDTPRTRSIAEDVARSMASAPAPGGPRA